MLINELLRRSSPRRKMCTLSVNDVSYQNISHGAAFYAFKGKSVNAMLEFQLNVLNYEKMFPLTSFHNQKDIC